MFYTSYSVVKDSFSWGLISSIYIPFPFKVVVRDCVRILSRLQRTSSLGAIRDMSYPTSLYRRLTPKTHEKVHEKVHAHFVLCSPELVSKESLDFQRNHTSQRTSSIGDNRILLLRCENFDSPILGNVDIFVDSAVLVRT